MDPRPDQERDTILHYVRELDTRGAPVRERWRVYLGKRIAYEASDRIDAIAFARRLAAASQRPAWVLQESAAPLVSIPVVLTLWDTSLVRKAVSLDPNGPTPVIGYIAMQQDGSWVHENGDGRGYASAEAAANAVCESYAEQLDRLLDGQID